MSLKQLKKQRDDFETLSDYEVFITKQFNQYIDEGNFKLCHEIADYIIENSIRYFSGKVRMDFLVWKLDRLTENLSYTNSQENDLKLKELVRSSSEILMTIPTSLHVLKEAIQEGVELISLYLDREDQNDFICRIQIVQSYLLGEVDLIQSYFELFKKYQTSSQEDLIIELMYYDLIRDYDSIYQLKERILKYKDFRGYTFLIRAFVYKDELEEAKKLFYSTLVEVEKENHLHHIIDYMENAVIIGNYKKLKYLNEMYKDEIINQCDLYYCMRYFIISSSIIPHHYMIAQNIVADFDRRNKNHYYKTYLDLFYENFKEQL